MKAAIITLVLAVMMTSLLPAAVVRGPGLHSTPAIWLAFPNLPGVASAEWAAQFNPKDEMWNGPLPWYIIGLGDWIAYFGLAKIAMLVRRKFST
jgi:hypothetical protein